MGDRNLDKDSLFRAVDDLITRDEFEKKIQEEIEDYGTFLDENTAALLLTDKLGRNTYQLKKISEVIPDKRATLFAKIERIYEEKEFDKIKMTKMLISDNTGSCLLTLWGNEADVITNSLIKKHPVIKIVNGYAKEGFHGLEISIGRWGFLELNPDNPPTIELNQSTTPLCEVTKGIISVQGTIEKIEKTHLFIKDNGEPGFVTRVALRDDTGTRQLIFWGEQVRNIQGYHPGDQIVIHGAYIRKNEIHVDAYSILTKDKT